MGLGELVEEEDTHGFVEIVDILALVAIPIIREIPFPVILGGDFLFGLEDGDRVAIEHDTDDVGLLDGLGGAVIEFGDDLEGRGIGPSASGAKALPLTDFLITGDGDEFIVEGLRL